MPFWNLDLNQPSATCDLLTTYPRVIAPWGAQFGVVKADCWSMSWPASLTWWDPIGTWLASESFFFNYAWSITSTPLFTPNISVGAHRITSYYYTWVALATQSIIAPVTGELELTYFGAPFYFRWLNPQWYWFSVYQFNSNWTVSAIQYTNGHKLDGYMFYNRLCGWDQDSPCAIHAYDFVNRYLYVYSGNFFPVITWYNFGGAWFSGIIDGSRLPDLVFTFPQSAYSWWRNSFHPPESDYWILTSWDSDQDFITFDQDQFISTGIVAPVFPTGGSVIPLPPYVPPRTISCDSQLSAYSSDASLTYSNILNCTMSASYATGWLLGTWWSIFTSFIGNFSNSTARSDFFSYYLAWVYDWPGNCTVAAQSLNYFVAKYWLSGTQYLLDYYNWDDVDLLECSYLTTLANVGNLPFSTGDFNSWYNTYRIPEPWHWYYSLTGDFGWLVDTGSMFSFSALTSCFNFLSWNSLWNNAQVNWPTTLGQVASCVVTSIAPSLSSDGYPFSRYLPPIPACLPNPWPYTATANTIFILFISVFMVKWYKLFARFLPLFIAD